MGWLGAKVEGRVTLSIVVANYNHGAFLEAALQSVFSQSCQDFELIVVDGGSTDNSAEIIRKHADRIAWWCSEKDRGQSDAFNKGLGHASGRFFTWLNADDLLLPHAVAHARQFVARHPEAEWVTANFCRFGIDGTIKECGFGPYYLPRVLQRPHAPVAAYGPTSFFARRIFEAAGGFDISLCYGMDIDLWQRFMRMGVPQHRLNHCCWAFRLHRDSKTSDVSERTNRQELADALRDERLRRDRKNGYMLSPGLLLAHRLWKILSGSAVISACRQRHWVGRPLDDLIKELADARN